MYNVKRQVRVVVEPPNQRKGAKNRKMVILSRKILLQLYLGYDIL